MQILAWLALYGGLGYSIALSLDLGTLLKFGLPALFLVGNMIVTPLLSSRAYRIDWNPEDPPLGDDVRQFLLELFQMHGKAPPAELAALLGPDRGLPIALGLVRQDAPQLLIARAPTGGAGIVVSDGFRRLLSPAEQKAALAHEVYYLLKVERATCTNGLMMLPSVLFMAYRFVDPDPGGNFFQRNIAQLLYAAYRASLALAAWTMRDRVFKADRFAVEMTGEPGALASAILRLTYGLARKGGEGLPDAGSPLDVADPAQGQHLAQDADALGDTSPEGLARALRWERSNLAARLFELFSHHPLPSRRLDELAVAAQGRGHDFPLETGAPRGGLRWLGLFAEVYGRAAPWLGGYLGYYYATEYGWPSDMPFWVVFGVFAGTVSAVVLWYKPLARYHPDTARGLLENLDVSDSFPVKAHLTGRIVGREKAGYAFGADLRFRDYTGAITLKYKQPVPLLDTAFAYFEADALHAEQVEVDGWFRRNPEPFLEVRRIRVLGTGRTFGCYFWIWYLLGLCAMGWFTHWVYANF